MYPPIAAENAQGLAYNAIDCALAKGLVVRAPPSVSNDPNVPVVTHAPFALFPSPFPANVYEEAIQLQPIFNKLVDACARDHEFVTKAMERYMGVRLTKS